MENVERCIKNRFGDMDHLPRRTYKGAEDMRMGGRIMVSMMDGMGRSLAQDDAAHDEKTGQYAGNEQCAWQASHHPNHRFQS